jgi:cell division protein FtsB
MSVIVEIRRRGRHIAGSILGALLFLYFVMHAVQGDRGLLAWLKIRQQIAIAETEYKVSEVQRKNWAHRIKLLRVDAMDRDMLDERARAITGFIKTNEFVVISGENGVNR